MTAHDHAHSPTNRYIEPQASPLPAPGGWEQSNVAFPETKLQVTIALLHTDEAEAKLEATFNAVSDPDHSSYGEHLSKAEVSAMFVMISRNLPRVSLSRSFPLTLTLTCAQINDAFDFPTGSLLLTVRWKQRWPGVTRTALNVRVRVFYLPTPHPLSPLV